MKLRTTLLGFAFTAAMLAGAQAEIIVAANDGHQPQEPGETIGRVPDTVSVLDFTNGNLKQLGIVQVPATVLGPPITIAIAPNARWAVVGNGNKGDPADRNKNIPDSTVSVIDISNPAQPRVTQTLQAGEGMTGVSINRQGTLVTVSNPLQDNVSVFTATANGQLTPAGTFQLKEGTRPGLITFMRDGRSAVMNSARGLLRISVNGSTLTETGTIIDITGSMVALHPNGRLAMSNGGPRPPAPAGGGGGGGGRGAAAAAPTPGAPAAGRGAAGGRGGAAGGPPPIVSLIDLETGTVKLTAPSGAGPEYIGFSPDGSFAAVTITNGSHSAQNTPAYNPYGIMRIYRVTNDTLTIAAETRTGRWCQSIIFSPDNRTVLIQCSVERRIEVYRFDGKETLTRDEAATLKFEAAPGAMVSVSSR